MRKFKWPPRSNCRALHNSRHLWSLPIRFGKLISFRIQNWHLATLTCDPLSFHPSCHCCCCYNTSQMMLLIIDCRFPANRFSEIDCTLVMFLNWAVVRGSSWFEWRKREDQNWIAGAWRVILMKTKRLPGQTRPNRRSGSFQIGKLFKSLYNVRWGGKTREYGILLMTERSSVKSNKLEQSRKVQRNWIEMKVKLTWTSPYD